MNRAAAQGACKPEAASQVTLLEAAARKQREASDPSVSAWVRANAGTGKTHVLVQRILRLLLAGAAPKSILCLTYTKNAAAEMEARVLAELGIWATATGEMLGCKLEAVLGRPPSVQEAQAARCLFASVIDAPGGMPMLTMHAFCERLLRSYSLEANVPAQFLILTEDEAADALDAATASASALANREPFTEALAHIVSNAGEDEFAKVLQALLCERAAVARLLRLAETEDPLIEAEARLRRLFGLSAADSADKIVADACACPSQATLESAVRVLATGSANDTVQAARFAAVIAAPALKAKFDALAAAFLTSAGTPRKSLMTEAVKKSAGSLHARLEAARATIADASEKLCKVRAVEASVALLRFAARIFEFYESEKRRRGALDFDGLIEKTLSLLSRAGAAEWVLQQLDARIDHVLVDEAQDTSPNQWAIVERLAGDFFSGSGVRETAPTIFAVGDEKQSIYGFQGAQPELLAENGARYRAKAAAAGLRWREADLDLSFRSLGPILDAVDCVSGALPGLSHGPAVPHVAFRGHANGFVEIWEPEIGEEAEPSGPWDAQADAASPPHASQVLAERIAARIEAWLAGGDVLPSTGRPIAPGDILILLRKREPMLVPLQYALKRKGIAVAGADRIALLEALPVMDLLVLVDALLQPDDDLALATVLKSPLFDVSEDELFALAHDRRGSLSLSLADAAAAQPSRYGATVATLSEWRKLSFSAEPFEFFARILDRHGARAAFASRLGPQCHDALDEFLALAEAFDGGNGSGLAAFVRFIRKSASDIKRESDRAGSEVRIMTVHGAKGLEASVVILADTCGVGAARGAALYFLGDGTGKPNIPCWAVKGTATLEPIAVAKEARRQAEEKERARLLYVAMTRARDRLYIAGFQPGPRAAKGCWHETVREALAGRTVSHAGIDGQSVERLGSYRPLDAIEDRQPVAPYPPLPAWTCASLPNERRVKVFAASSLMPWTDGGNVPAVDSYERGDAHIARLKGQLTHRLLELLPGFAVGSRDEAALLIGAVFGGGLTRGLIETAARNAIALLDEPALSALFSNGLAECGIIGFLDGEGERAILAGQADRIVIDGHNITILDYKSGASGARGHVPDSHTAQLAAYRFLLQRMYPLATVGAVLIRTPSKQADVLQDRKLDAVMSDLRRGLGSAP